MNKKLTLLAFGSAFIGMGIAMPSCPGQQAMQQQIDADSAKSAENAKNIQTLTGQVKTISDDLAQVKTQLSQVSNTVLAQKASIEQMEATLKAASAHKAAPAKKRR